MIVNAFHGYGHNYSCQTRNHPNQVAGVGLEDLETLERIFSRSNELASITRYSTAYRQRELINEFFKQWDEDKYLNLTTMLLDNYKQALEIITNDTPALEEAKVSLDIRDDDLEQWEKEEAEYFRTLGQEDQADVHVIAYAKLLHEFWKLE
jgi:hypothetical protein